MKNVFSQLLKNIFASYTSAILGLLITYFFTPYFISKIGMVNYGIWGLAFSILYYMAMADLGMQQALVRHISKHLPKKDWNKINEVFSSAALIYVLISVTILLSTYIICFHLISHFKIPPESMNLARNVILIFGINSAIGYFLIPFTALGAYNRFDITNYIEISKRLIQTIVIVIILEMGYGLIEVTVGILIIRIIQHVLKIAIRKKLFPETLFNIKYIKRKTIKKLFSYSIYSFLLVVSMIIIYETDNIVIGWLISIESVAIYSIPALIVTNIRNLFGLIAVPLVPTISQLESTDDYSSINSIFMKATKYLTFLVTFISILALLFGGEFILLWLEKDFFDSIKILYILIIPACLSIPLFIANSILYGISKHKIAFYILGSEAVSNIVLSIILAKIWGITGVAIGTAIPQVIIYSLIYPLIFLRIINGSAKRYYINCAKSVLLNLVVILPLAITLSILVPAESWFTLILDGLLLFIVMFIIFSRFILTTDDKESLLNKMKSKLLKKLIL